MPINIQNVNVEIEGTDADGTPPTGDPVLVAGQDGTNVQSLKTNATGQLEVDVVAGGGTGGLTDAELRATPVPISIDQTGNNNAVDVLTSALPTGAATAANQQTDALTDTELRATPVPVSGTVAATLSEPISVDDNGGSLTVDGTVAVSNMVAQGLTDTELRATPVPVSMSSDIELGAVELKNGTDDTRATVTAANALKVDGSAVTQPVSAAALPLPTGAATAANQQTDALTDTELRATPVPVSGTVSVTEPVSVDDNGGSLTVDNLILTDVHDVGNQALQVSVVASTGGGLTDAELRATPVPVSGAVTATLSEPISVDDNGGSLTVDGSVAVSNFPATAYAEDTASASGDIGVYILGVRNEALTQRTDAEGDYSPISVDAFGQPQVIVNNTSEIQVNDTNWSKLELADNFSPPDMPSVGAFGMLFDGSFWDRWRGNSTDGALVNLGANNDVTVTGSVTSTPSVVGGGTEATAQRVTIANDSTGVVSVDDNGGSLTVDGSVSLAAAIPAGTNNIGDVDVLSLNGQSADGAAVAGNPVRIAGKDGSGNTQDIAVATDGTLLVQGIQADGGSAAAVQPFLVAGQDGTNVQSLKTDTNGELQIDVLTLPATPAGSNLIGKINNVPIATDGCTIFRSLDLDETEEEVKGTAGAVYGWAITNRRTSTIWLKFYNATAANVTVGSTTPVITWGIPGNSTDNVGANMLGGVGIKFDTAITVAATTGFADADTGAPAANDCIANIFYL